jgi:short-subunit dehydrogenase
MPQKREPFAPFLQAHGTKPQTQAQSRFLSDHIMAPLGQSKPWIVTGASRGLGAALVRELAARGESVVAIARDQAQLQQLQATSPERITICALDLSKSDQIKSALLNVLAAFSGISGVFNNAGIGSYKAFSEHSEAELIDIVQVNLTAVMQICHIALPILLRQGFGHIVNIGSDLGRRPLANMAAYVASKHGLTGFSHSLLREVKSAGVRVSLVNPGMIDTHFGGGGSEAGLRDEAKHLKPEALAKLIVDITQQPGHLLIDELTVHPLGQADF